MPVEELKKFKTDKELLAAVEDAKAPGMHSLNGHFPDHLNAKAADPRKSIVHRYRLTKLDAKTGATLEPIPDDKRMEEEAAAPTSFPWVAAGLALAGLVAFVGLALAARLRKAG